MTRGEPLSNSSPEHAMHEQAKNVAVAVKIVCGIIILGVVVVSLSRILVSSEKNLPEIHNELTVEKAETTEKLTQPVQKILGDNLTYTDSDLGISLQLPRDWYIESPVIRENGVKEVTFYSQEIFSGLGQLNEELGLLFSVANGSMHSCYSENDYPLLIQLAVGSSYTANNCWIFTKVEEIPVDGHTMQAFSVEQVSQPPIEGDWKISVYLVETNSGLKQFLAMSPNKDHAFSEIHEIIQTVSFF